MDLSKQFNTPNSKHTYENKKKIDIVYIFEQIYITSCIIFVHNIYIFIINKKFKLKKGY